MNKQKEKGITLIALILMIVIIVILAAVTIRGLTGNEGIINVTEMAAVDYNVQSYREQVEQTVRSSIIAHGAVGENATLEQIAEDLKWESLWVKDAVANTGTENDDILVTVTAGYTYQVYYNETYGTVFVEFIGKGESFNDFPTLTSKYTKAYVTITSEASIEKGSIDKLELIYRGEIKNTEEGSNLSVDVKEYGTGWYKVRATADNGNVRYNWVRVATVSDRLTPPIIRYEPASPDGNAPWYKQDVKVIITSDNMSALKIHYCLGGASLADGAIDNTDGIHGTETGSGDARGEVSFTITAEGRSTITAWVTDDEESESDVARGEIQLDKTDPTNVVLSERGLSGDNINEKQWYKDKEGVGIKVTAEDAISQVAGYYTQIGGADKSARLDDMEKEIKITNEGRTRVKVFVADKAGRETSKETTIQIDKTAPNAPTITMKEKTTNSITYTVNATDDTKNTTDVSGIEKIELTMTGPDGFNQENTINTANGEVTFTGLKPGRTYSVTGTATDNAGNKGASGTTDSVETKFVLGAPEIKFEATSESGPNQNNYYTGTVEVTLTDDTEDSTAEQFRYQVTSADGGAYSDLKAGKTENIPEGKALPFELDKQGTTAEGTITIKAWTLCNGHESTPAEKSFERDSQKPYKPFVSVKQETVIDDTLELTVVAQDKEPHPSNITKVVVTLTPTEGPGKEEGELPIVEEVTGFDNHNTEKTVTIKGLTQGTKYSIGATAHDKAGWQTDSDEEGEQFPGDKQGQNPNTDVTTKPVNLEAPEIEFSCGEGCKNQNGWHNGAVVVTITDTNTSSTATHIVYKITGAGQDGAPKEGAVSSSNNKVTYTIEKTTNSEGQYTVEAYTRDDWGNGSQETTRSKK